MCPKSDDDDDSTWYIFLMKSLLPLDVYRTLQDVKKNIYKETFTVNKNVNDNKMKSTEKIYQRQWHRNFHAKIMYSNSILLYLSFYLFEVSLMFLCILNWITSSSSSTVFYLTSFFLWHVISGRNTQYYWRSLVRLSFIIVCK